MLKDDAATCLAEWSSRGPRYTSYPPATQFGPIADDVIGRELATIARLQERVSLYLHVPFCKSLCWYCGCNVIPTRDETRGIGYVDDLSTELALVAGHLGGKAPITEIALGGGSPNFLAPRTLRTLLKAVESYFSVAEDARRSIELDPRSTTGAQIDAVADLGFTALSVGVQDFAAPVQDAINRHQSIMQTRWLVDYARTRGFEDVNIDIVYGLPRQSELSFAMTLDAVLAMQPDRVALFGYAHLPSKLPHQALVERAGRVLDQYERASLLLAGIERFTQAGYIHLGLDHFARPGSRLARAAADQRMIRTFQGYTERVADATIGIGTSAISSTSRVHWQNHTQLAPWQDALARQRMPVERGFVLDDDDRLRATLINRLMCDGDIDLHRLGSDFAVDAPTYFARELRRLGELAELARYHPETNSIETTELGRLLVRNVCMLFDRYQENSDATRYSSTI